MNRILFGLAIWPLLAWGQEPIINPGGVVNAASYATGLEIYMGNIFTTLPGGSIATIFGTNLAASKQSAQSTPLPRQLAGTSVSVNGIAAPLFYVSPTQINFQMPSSNETTPGISTANGIVVGTTAGLSDPYVTVITGLNSVPGVFTMDASGCGQGAVLNVSADGSTSLNSPTNSAVPGDYVSIYGTGQGDLFYNEPPDGTPAPSNPLATGGDAGPVFEFYEYPGIGPSWSGRAPGFVGLDQFNSQIPETVRQGCAVPFQLIGDNISPPVTISIASGGGTCADPPTQGYGEILWEKTVTTTVGLTYTVTETDTLTVSLQASPGKEAPTPPPVFTEGGILPGGRTYYGPSCPIPGYRSLGAGTVTVQGPGLAATPAAVVTLQGGTTFAELPYPASGNRTPFESGQVSGLTVYQATLPSGTIQQGAFEVLAGGGSDVGPFQSAVQIGSPIQIQTALANLVLYAGQPYTITWTGGDSNAWVTVKLVTNEGPYDYYYWAWETRASDESITITGQEPGESYGVGGPFEMVIEVVPDPSQVPALSAPGLSLGGLHLWKYTYRFEGLTAQD